MRVKRAMIGTGAVGAATAVTVLAASHVGALPDYASEQERPPVGAVVVEGAVTREGQGPARVVVRRGPGAPAGFTWTTSPRSASARRDYAPRAGRLQFRAGQHARVLTIPVREDAEREGPQVFEVRLAALPGAPARRGDARAAVWILDGS
jgi:Calx-beta domain